MATKDLLSLNLSANYNPVVYYVYILARRSRMLYTGVTNSADRRIAEHKHKLIEGFTRRYDIDRLVHLEEHSSIVSAITREKQIKGWTRAKNRFD